MVCIVCTVNWMTLKELGYPTNYVPLNEPKGLYIRTNKVYSEDDTEKGEVM